MKIRFGFVSNSSSASFLIATKRELTVTLLRKKLIKYFRSKYNYNRNIVEEAVNAIFGGINLEKLYEIEDPSELWLYKTLKGKEFKYFYPGGVVDNYFFLFGIEIFDEDFNLIIAKGF